MSINVVNDLTNLTKRLPPIPDQNSNPDPLANASNINTNTGLMQDAPASKNVGIPNQPTETNDPISRYQKYVEGIQRPDLSSLLTGYDQQTNQAANDVKKAESNRKWAALADLGNLVGGYIGARGGANVNVNPQNNEGVYNQAINKLSNTYRQYQSGRPDLVAKLALQKYNEQMQGAGAMLKGIELSDKEKEEFNKDQIALKTLQWKVNNGTATLQQRKDYDDANISIKNLMAKNGAANASANLNRSEIDKTKAEYETPTHFIIKKPDGTISTVATTPALTLQIADEARGDNKFMSTPEGQSLKKQAGFGGGNQTVRDAQVAQTYLQWKMNNPSNNKATTTIPSIVPQQSNNTSSIPNALTGVK